MRTHTDQNEPGQGSDAGQGPHVGSRYPERGRIAQDLLSTEPAAY